MLEWAVKDGILWNYYQLCKFSSWFDKLDEVLRRGVWRWDQSGEDFMDAHTQIWSYCGAEKGSPWLSELTIEEFFGKLQAHEQ